MGEGRWRSRKVTALDVSIESGESTRPVTLVRVMQTRSLLITDNKIALPTCDAPRRVPQSTWRWRNPNYVLDESQAALIPGTVSILEETRLSSFVDDARSSSFPSSSLFPFLRVLPFGRYQRVRLSFLFLYLKRLLLCVTYFKSAEKSVPSNP